MRLYTYTIDMCHTKDYLLPASAAICYVKIVKSIMHICTKKLYICIILFDIMSINLFSSAIYSIILVLTRYMRDLLNDMTAAMTIL